MVRGESKEIKKMVVLGKSNQSIMADCKWLRTSEELEIELIVTEGSIAEVAKCGMSNSYVSMQCFLENPREVILKYDYFFVVDDCEVIHRQLVGMGIPTDRIYLHANISRFLRPEQKMRFLEEALDIRDHKRYEREFLSVGRFTYGVPNIRFCTNEKEAIKIGAFCSIAAGVTIFGGGGASV